jgi:hypothetical protein
MSDRAAIGYRFGLGDGHLKQSCSADLMIRSGSMAGTLTRV